MVENSITEAGWESESPLRSWAVSCEPPDALLDPIALVAPALDAMFLVANGLLQPLAVGTDIIWLDTELGVRSGYAPRMEWKLVQQGVDDRRWPVPETLVRVDEINRDAIDKFLRRACDQRGEPGMIACPASISFSSTRVRLFESLLQDAAWLRLVRKEGPATVPTESEAGCTWVIGPQDGFITAPVELWLAVDASELTLRVNAHWSPWADADRPGTLAIEERIARLLTSGWERIE